LSRWHQRFFLPSCNRHICFGGFADFCFLDGLARNRLVDQSPYCLCANEFDGRTIDRFLRVTARRTWHYFETFVTAQENWLPPDNFQEVPSAVIATRTSPTNMGLALLANLAARDFGYLSVGRLIQRTQDSFATMQRLERHRGHFYNWYETRTLQPLQPLYVSSVDSGNLAGHLLTLARGLRELADEPIFTPQIFAGLRDTLSVLRGLAGANVKLAQLDAELASACQL
jgi:cyclic beta-1,2-glucan synthetase